MSWGPQLGEADNISCSKLHLDVNLILAQLGTLRKNGTSDARKENLKPLYIRNERSFGKSARFQVPKNGTSIDPI